MLVMVNGRGDLARINGPFVTSGNGAGQSSHMLPAPTPGPVRAKEVLTARSTARRRRDWMMGLLCGRAAGTLSPSATWRCRWSTAWPMRPTTSMLSTAGGM